MLYVKQNVIQLLSDAVQLVYYEDLRDIIYLTKLEEQTYK